jgi:hypothetical protein
MEWSDTSMLLQFFLSFLTLTSAFTFSRVLAGFESSFQI